MKLLEFLVILGCISCISCQKTCNSRRTCGACIGHAAAKCVWCSEDKNLTDFRCQPYNETHTDWCKNDHILSSHTINKSKQDNPFSDTIQLRPQERIIKARPGEVINFTISYKPAKDFPLDVYFLMDYTYTMKSHVELLQKQLKQIYLQLTKLTNNVKLGVGSFIEKPGLPYADVHVSNTVYVFKNHLNLTNDKNAFKRFLEKTPVFGSNYDDAEAGLDALMQVMKCTNELGWRKDTKRIIVLATDNTYHSAGDGKMLGAFKPNDMKCHLDDDEYKQEYSLKYDYPSVSQINKVATDGHFLIIFAGLSKVEKVYKSLSTQIQASTFAELKEESNIMEIIEKEYNKSVSAIKILPNAPSSFQVTIDQICPSENTGNCTNCKETKNCVSTPNNTIVQIPVYIKSKECATSSKPHVITFNPGNGLGDKVIVKFEVDCQCECEKTRPSETHDKCNKKGFIQCGACKCDKDWGGDTCEINCSDDKSMELETKCYRANSTEKCHGHGTCECGKCLCTDGFTGDLCEYDPTSCHIGKNGHICGGHGTCEFGKCSCVGDWTGIACDCLIEEKSLEKCTGPFSKKICSGNGNCTCGICYCHKKNENEMYTGAFCDFCEDCAIERCRELEDYAKCNHNKTKDFCDNNFHLTDDINLKVIVANKTELLQKNEWTTGTQCRTELDDGTFLLFKYSADTRNYVSPHGDFDTKKMLLMIQKEVEIPPKADMFVPIASVIAAILLIGLLTIVFWKVLIEWYDKREYNKFCNEAKSQGFDVSRNPLYEAPTQTFVNPACDRNIQ